MKTTSPSHTLYKQSGERPSRDFLQSAMDSMIAVVLVLNEDRKIEFINKSCISVLGFEPEEVIGKTIEELVFEEDIESTLVYLEKLKSPDPVNHFENRFYHKGGGIIPISWAGNFNCQSGYFYCCVRDFTERRQVLDKKYKYEQELFNRNLGLTNILDCITDGFFVLDDQWRFIYANHVVEKMVDTKLEDVLLKTIWECFPLTVDSIFEQQYKFCFTHQVPVSFEGFYGEPMNIWFKINAFPSANGLSVFIRNITEERLRLDEMKAYEQKIQEQNTNLIEILEGITDAFYTLDRNWKITYFNRQAEKLSGFNSSDILSKTIWECFPGIRDTTIGSHLRKVMKEQKPLYFEAPSTINEGMILEFSVNPSNAGLSVFYRDITEKKKAEEEIRKLSLIAKETVNNVVILTPDNRITWVNEAFTRKTGYSFEEVIGRLPGTLLNGPETDEEVILHIREKQRQKLPYEVEILNYKKNGEPYWAEIYAQPFFDANGNIEHYFSIETDITDRKMLEKHMEMERNKITAAVIDTQEKERSQIGRELHDNVNQVLTTVKLYTELCRDGVGNTGDLLDKSIKLLQESITEIRSLSKRLSAPSLGKMKLKDSVHELVDSIEATNKLEIILELEEIFELDLTQELHMAVYRILQEHLTNILKHAAASLVTISFKLVNKRLIMSVFDNGQGFDQSKEFKGIGIRNMKLRAESLKGTLVIKSSPGSGCQLTLRLPV